MKQGAVVRILAACGYGFLLSPLVVVVLLSFSSGDYLAFPPPGWTLHWYAALLDNASLMRAARNSAILASIVTAVAMAAGLPAAHAVAKGMVPASARLIFTLPLLLPTLVIGLGLLMVLQPVGLLASWTGLALGHLAVVLPFVIRLLTASFATLPPDLEDAAASLGASPLRAFIRVSLPLAIPGALAAATLSFLLSFDETVISLFLAGPRLTTLPVAMFHYTEQRADPLVAAVAGVLIAFALAVVLVVSRLVGFTGTLAR